MLNYSKLIWVHRFGNVKETEQLIDQFLCFPDVTHINHLILFDVNNVKVGTHNRIMERGGKKM